MVLHPPAYLAFDLGASSGRAMLGTLHGERLELETLHRFTTPILETNDGLFWDVEAIGRALDEGLRQALRTAPGLRSLSVDSWGVDYVPLDGEGRPVRLPYCYRDPRTNGLMEEAFDTVSAADIYAATGIQFMSINTLYQLLADRRDAPELLERTANRLTMADFFNHRFGGRPACEVSLASTTQLMDVHARDWAYPLLRAFGLPGGGWPEIVPSGTILGQVDAHRSVSVVAGCSHDTACAVAAVPAATEARDWAYISCGTWSLLGVERDEPLLTDAARQAGFTNEAGVGGTIRLLKNLTGLWALQECVREWGATGPEIYSTLLAEARDVPAEFARINLEDPRFLARGGMEERLRAYCREHGQRVPRTRGEITRTIIESIVDSYRRTIVDLERITGRSISTIHIVGGGAQNDLLCRRTAEACGCRVVAGPVEATALGNLLVQAQALGELPAGKTLRDVVRNSSSLTTYDPHH